jgi:FHA domain-containing protein/uncharacterized protein DUF1707
MTAGRARPADAESLGRTAGTRREERDGPSKAVRPAALAETRAPGENRARMRASDRDREQALAVLRRRCAEGYLSVDTFERRVERTFAARTIAELRSLVADVSAEPSWLRRLRRSGLPRVPAVPVALPVRETVLVGRGRRCDVVVEHPTVSRRHLELRPAGDGAWLATDVGSLNGTWLRNRRVGRTIVVPGDELWLGSCPVRLG